MAKKTKKRTVKKAIDTSRKTNTISITGNIFGEVVRETGTSYWEKATVVDIIKGLQKLVDHHGKDCFVRGNRWSDDDHYELFEVVPETDEQYERRMVRNKKARESAKKAAITRKKNQEAKDLEEWGRLNKKFGKGWTNE